MLDLSKWKVAQLVNWVATFQLTKWADISNFLFNWLGLFSGHDHGHAYAIASQ